MTVSRAAIPPDQIRIPAETVRHLDRAWAATIGRSMKEIGQRQDINVAVDGDGYELVFGLHRLVGAQIEKLSTINALVDDAPGSAAERRRRAIHENLFRHDLCFLDRAIHIAEEHAITRAARGERRGGDRKSAAAMDQRCDDRTFDLGLGLSEEIAAKVGLSERTVHEAVQIAHGVDGGFRHRIFGSAALEHLADSRADLMRFIGETDPRKTRILDLIEKGDAATVADAVALLDGMQPDSESERHWKLANSAFARLRGKNRDRFFAEHEADFSDWQRRKGKR